MDAENNGENARLLEERLRLAEERLALESAERIHAEARVAELAQKDELTGLPNLGAWTEGIIRELARARRSGDQLAVVLLDIDDFGMFNEAFGAHEGDQLLQRVTLVWRDCIRPYDLLARFGRDEFGLVITGASREDALTVCARLRAAMPSGHNCSAGIAGWDGVEGIDELVDRAEAALEAAKLAGPGQSVAV